VTGASGQLRGYDALLRRTLLSRDAFEQDFRGGVRVTTRSFLAYPDDFGGGVNVGTGDTDGDGQQEVIAAPQARAPASGGPAPEQPVRTFAPGPDAIEDRGALPMGSDGPGGGDASGGGADGGADAGGF